jgi:hypothetical protein
LFIFAARKLHAVIIGKSIGRGAWVSVTLLEISGVFVCSLRIISLDITLTQKQNAIS